MPLELSAEARVTIKELGSLPVKTSLGSHVLGEPWTGRQ